MISRTMAGLTALFMLVGCASAENLNSWQGHSARELVSAMGEPIQRASLQEGGEELSYHHVMQRGGTGRVPTGSLGAAAGGQGSLLCTVTFRTDPQNTIISADTAGPFDACNEYLETVAAAQ